MKKVSAIIVGAGARGIGAYAPYAKIHPEKLAIVGVADPDENKRKILRDTYGFREDMCFESYEELFKRERLADAAIICTGDAMHYDPSRLAVERGYHVLLEKPISPDPLEVYRIGKVAEKSDKVFLICHVLRYTAFFRKIKELIDEGRVGRIMSVMHNENVQFQHQAHSFVRGNWRNSKTSSPMILAKSCHDMDILLYLIGKNCKKVSSFGSLGYFKKENAPKGAPDRCTDGCPYENTCPYNPLRMYTEGELRGWCGIFGCSPDDPASLIEALKVNDYGRCVFRCDNDVVDHQVVSMEFEDGITCVFTMSAFTQTGSRTIKIMGTHGEIGANMSENVIVVKDFASGSVDTIKVRESVWGHGGGDLGITEYFVNAVNGGDRSMTSAQISVQSHMMAFAAEKSRVEGCTVDLDRFTKEIAALTEK